MNRKEYEEDLANRQRDHLNSIRNNLEENWQPCLHDCCPECIGTGQKITGGICIHNLSCQCPKCGSSNYKSISITT